MEKNVRLVEAEENDIELLENLMTLYLHDLSSYAKDLKINVRGKFIYDGMNYYFSEAELMPFLILYGDEPAGFILLNSGKYVSLAVDYSVHEFFVLKGFRKFGIGRQAAEQIFQRYPGRYKIEQLVLNEPAIRFWKAVYHALGISFSEMTEISDGQSCLFQIFNTTGVRGDIND